MVKQPLDVRKLGFYYSLAQVGLEMALPAGIGYWVDYGFQTQPWGVIIGAVLGLAVGMLHLVALLNQQNKNRDTPSGETQDQP
jgi:F0F1-type ATP synthase assembly protein I